MRSRILLIIGLVAILLLASIGFIVVKGNTDQAVRKSTDATATTQAVSTRIAGSNATATAAISTLQNPYPPHTGTLLVNAPLDKNTKNPAWDEGTTPNYGSCTFTAGVYDLQILQANQFWYCTDESSTFSDFAYQVQVKILKGDQGGIAFRSGAGGSLYYFYIDTQGNYELDVNKNHNFIKAISHGFSSTIKTGIGQSNLIAVVAQGNSFDLYVNLQHLAHASDTTFSDGQIGMLVLEQSHPTEVAFSNAKVWKL